MTAPRALGVAVGAGTAGSGSWEAGKAARFRVGWSCRDWERGTGAAYGFSGTRCATRLCGERPGRVGRLLCGTPPHGSWGLGGQEGAGQASEFQLSIERGSWSRRTGKTERQTCACLCPHVLRSVAPGSRHVHVCVHARPPPPVSVCEDRNRERLTLCGPSWGSTGLCIGGVWERGPGGPGEAWGTGGSGPVLPGLLLAKGEFCCLFILVLSSTCDVTGRQAGRLLSCSPSHIPTSPVPPGCTACPFPSLGPPMRNDRRSLRQQRRR